MMVASAPKYRMSFSTGGLFPDESEQLAGMYVDLQDWNLVAEKARDENILQFRTSASSHRTGRELIARLKGLTEDELAWLVDADVQLRGLILWVAVCRLYQFVAEFMAELVQERYSAYRLELTHDDFDAFLNRKAEWHEEIDALTEMTRKKIRQILFRMMKEGGVLSSENRITSPLPTSSVTVFRERLPDHERAFIPGWGS
jgi:BrxA